MRYSLIIPAWNEADFIGHTLTQVRRVMQEVSKTTGHSGQLIVVDNNSTDETAAIAAEFGADVVFEPVNQIARARNRGAEMADGEALIFLDADTQCSAVLVCEVLAHLASGQVVGGGSVIAPDRPVTGAALQTLKGWNALSRRFQLAAGCFVFCRRDAFDAVGGFNTQVYAGEELFLSRRLKRWGRRQGMRMHIATVEPVVTSVRKLDWNSRWQILQQLVLILIPGAIYSKRLCRAWYSRDNRAARPSGR